MKLNKLNNIINHIQVIRLYSAINTGIISNIREVTIKYNKESELHVNYM